MCNPARSHIYLQHAGLYVSVNRGNPGCNELIWVVIGIWNQFAGCFRVRRGYVSGFVGKGIVSMLFCAHITLKGCVRLFFL